MSDFEEFVKERIYLRNISPRTTDFYRDSWASFQRYGGELTKAVLAKYDEVPLSVLCTKEG